LNFALRTVHLAGGELQKYEIIRHLSRLPPLELPTQPPPVELLAQFPPLELLAQLLPLDALQLLAQPRPQLVLLQKLDAYCLTVRFAFQAIFNKELFPLIISRLKQS
jgi:hypothetical protein